MTRINPKNVFFLSMTSLTHQLGAGQTATGANRVNQLSEFISPPPPPPTPGIEPPRGALSELRYMTTGQQIGKKLLEQGACSRTLVT